MAQTINLGQVAAIITGSTPPNPRNILWYDTNVQILKYYNNAMAQWEPVPGMIDGASPPPSQRVLWHNTADGRVYYYDTSSSAWVLLGSGATAANIYAIRLRFDTASPTNPQDGRFQTWDDLIDYLAANPWIRLNPWYLCLAGPGPIEVIADPLKIPLGHIDLSNCIIVRADAVSHGTTPLVLENRGAPLFGVLEVRGNIRLVSNGTVPGSASIIAASDLTLDGVELMPVYGNWEVLVRSGTQANIRLRENVRAGSANSFRVNNGATAAFHIHGPGVQIGDESVNLGITGAYTVNIDSTANSGVSAMGFLQNAAGLAEYSMFHRRTFIVTGADIQALGAVETASIKLMDVPAFFDPIIAQISVFESFGVSAPGNLLQAQLAYDAAVSPSSPPSGFCVFLPTFSFDLLAPLPNYTNRAGFHRPNPILSNDNAVYLTLTTDSTLDQVLAVGIMVVYVTFQARQ